MRDVFLQARTILAHQLDLAREEELLTTTRFGDLHADSIDILETIMALEDLYDVDFPESQLEDFQEFGDLVSVIDNYLKSVGK